MVVGEDGPDRPVLAGPVDERVGEPALDGRLVGGDAGEIHRDTVGVFDRSPRRLPGMEPFGDRPLREGPVFVVPALAEPSEAVTSNLTR